MTRRELNNKKNWLQSTQQSHYLKIFLKFKASAKRGPDSIDEAIYKLCLIKVAAYVTQSNNLQSLQILSWHMLLVKCPVLSVKPALLRVHYPLGTFPHCGIPITMVATSAVNRMDGFIKKNLNKGYVQVRTKYWPKQGKSKSIIW